MKRPRYRWVTGAIGGGILLYGLWGLVQHRGATHPYEAARLLVGLDVVHDLLVVPVVLAVWLRARRVLPPAIAGVVGVGLLITGVVSAFAFPVLRGYGRSASNPSRLPNNYATGLATVLVLVWLTLGVVGMARWLRTRRP